MFVVASFRTDGSVRQEEMRAQVKHAANDMPVLMGASQGHPAMLSASRQYVRSFILFVAVKNMSCLDRQWGQFLDLH